MVFSLPTVATILVALAFAAALLLIFVAGVRLDVRAERRRGLPGLDA